MSENKESRTLFVRNIPFRFTNDKLEDKFSEFGPVKECFIVHNRDSGKSRGFGYVKFTLLDDAKRANESDVSLEGRKAMTSFADISKKIRRPPRKQLERKENKSANGIVNPDDDDDGDDEIHDDRSDDSDMEVTNTNDENVEDGAPKKGQILKYHKAKIVALTGLPGHMTEEEVNSCLQEKNVKQLAELKLLSGGELAHLKFKSVRDAKKAIRRLHNQVYKDSTLKAVQLSKDSVMQPQTMLKKCRVIVRNLSFQCTDDQLKKAFQHCGEITEVVLPTNRAGRKLGFGFVQYTRLPDAKKAVEEMNTKKILGRPVAVDWALPKTKYESTQQGQEEESSEEEGSSGADENDSSDDEKDNSVKKTQKRMDVSDNNDSDDGGGSGSDDDDDDDRESDGDSDDVVTFKNCENNRKNLNHDADTDDDDDSDEEEDDDESEDDDSIKGRNMSTEIDENEGDDDEGGDSEDDSDDDDDEGDDSEDDSDDDSIKEEKMSDESDDDDEKEEMEEETDESDENNDLDLVEDSKENVKKNVPAKEKREKGCQLFIRNLLFATTKKKMMDYFGKYGEIDFVKIVCNKRTGISKGMGFVTFKAMASADQCLSDAQEGKISLDGRQLYVEASVSKKEALEIKVKKEKEKEQAVAENDGLTLFLRKLPPQTTEEDLKEYFRKYGELEFTKVVYHLKTGKSREMGFVRFKAKSSVDKCLSDAQEGKIELHGRTLSVLIAISKEQRNMDKEKETRFPKKNDTGDGCTLFVRNLSYDTDEEGLKEYFGKYGDLVYAKVVYNHETEHSKGVGFVRFRTKSSADQCLSDAQEGKISLDGRELAVVVAVSRDKATELTEKKGKEKKDNRNLYLAREGMIRPGTQAAEGLSKADLDKRMKVEEVKRQKLKNLNIFISPLRLCVRNIPVSVDDKKLREVFFSAAGDKTAKITECRIMRDRARTKADGIGKSQGFGFVSFTDHQHALAALKHTNNNPEIFGDKKRLIVEFSLENRRALEVKEKRKAKMQAKILPKQLEGKARGKPTKKSSIPLLELSEKDKKLKGDNVQKGLPSHWGPKIRHKPRPSQTASGKKAKKQQQKQHDGKTQKRKSDQQTEGPVQKKQKNKETVDDFDKIVNKYKNKLVAKKDDGKWFE